MISLRDNTERMYSWHTTGMIYTHIYIHIIELKHGQLWTLAFGRGVTVGSGTRICGARIHF